MGPHNHTVGSQAEGRSLCGDAGLLECPWYTRPRDNNHSDVAGRLDDWGTHDLELRMWGLLGRDHLDNHGDQRRVGHLSCLSHPGGSPSSGHPELVGHHIACWGTGSARRGPSVGWVVAPTHRALERRQMGAQAWAGIARGPCGLKWMGAKLPSAPGRHSPYGEGPPGRDKDCLWKATEDGHILRVEAGWSNVEHLQSCLRPSRDVVAVDERRGSELV